MTESPFHKAFLDELADIANAEEQLVEALPNLVTAADSDQLRETFRNHLDETIEHVSRLKRVVASVGGEIVSNTCEAMEGLIAETHEMLEEYDNSIALDAVLISCAQKVEHYEIASYGTLVAWAKQMGHREAAEILERTLLEERAADSRLTAIATHLANKQAQSDCV